MDIKTAILSIFLAISLTSVAADYKVVCYFGSWSVYRNGNGKFDISQFDPTLCTHIIYTFTGITPDGNLRVLDPWADLPDGGGLNGYGKTIALKQRSPGTKVMLAVGGWNEGSATFSQVAANPGARSAFARNVANFLRKYGFDGFDVDWEYPNQRGGQWADKQNYVEMLRELKQELGKSGLLLSAAVAAAESSASQSYLISEISRHLDFINVMAYDFNGSWNKFTGLNAPLYASSRESGNQALLNVNSAIHYWLSQGAPANKLVLGVPLYGRSFTLQDPNNHDVGAPATGAGAAGPFTAEAGMLGYNEICMMTQQDGWTVSRDNQQREPYAFKGNQWVGYDDPTALVEKANYVKSLGLAGAMVWSIETDDFRGTCGQKYPLLNALKNALRGDAPVPPPPNPPPTPKPTPAPTPGPPGPTPPTNDCTHTGYYRDPHDCGTFYYCEPVGNTWSRFTYHCPAGLAFNPSFNGCDYRQNVPGCYLGCGLVSAVSSRRSREIIVVNVLAQFHQPALVLLGSTKVRVTFLTASMAASIDDVAGRMVVGYFGSWSVYRPGAGKFDITRFDPRPLTHIIYCFVGVTPDGDVKVLDPWADLPDDGGLNGFGKITGLRRRSPDTKIMISVGGWNAGSSVFSRVAGDPETRARFAMNMVKFLRKYKFDGCDIDWEYPCKRGGRPCDKYNFVDMLEELRRRLDRHGLLLSVAVGASKETAEVSYRVADIAEHVHFINLMTYDYHGPCNGRTGHNAPLNLIKKTVTYWINHGAPADQLVLGIPCYGKTFTLESRNDYGVNAPIEGPGPKGPYMKEEGTLGYNEISESFEEKKPQLFYDDEAGAPYALKGKVWISYDNANSVKKKAQYARKKDLAGLMAWSIDTDDFNRNGSDEFMLVHFMNRFLSE